VLYLAKVSNGQPVLLKDISETLHIPHHFLGKVLQILTRNGIVVSKKGQHGGYELSGDASKITLMDIVKAIDGDSYLSKCVLGFPGCSDENPCPVHTSWGQSKKLILEMLNNKTIEKLSKELDGKLDQLNLMFKSKKM
jgi:Rrf2 family protein